FLVSRFFGALPARKRHRSGQARTADYYRLLLLRTPAAGPILGGSSPRIFSIFLQARSQLHSIEMLGENLVVGKHPDVGAVRLMSVPRSSRCRRAARAPSVRATRRPHRRPDP